MNEMLAFGNPQVQNALLDISREILTSDLLHGINAYADFRIKVTENCPATQEYLHSALGAEALFAVWRQPVKSTYDNILHIVKIDTEGAIIPGSETMVGTVFNDRVVHRSGEFTDVGVRKVEAFAQRQEALPWQADASTGLYQLAN